MSAEDVLDVARTYLTHIKRTGNDNIMARCPFHVYQGAGHNSAPLTMSLSSGLWVCFSCGAKGNMRSFLRDMGLTWDLIQNQYKFLLESLTDNSPQLQNPLRPAHVFYDTAPLPDSLLGLFDFCPLGLLAEGFTEGTLFYFDIGYDQRHGRVTYPLRDIVGNLVGISGRALDDVTWPKYKVYEQEYEDFDLPKHHTEKRAILWNAHHIFPGLRTRTRPPIIVVEGFKAAMWLHQLGFPDVVALLGNSMSDEQQWLFELLGAEVYFLLDNDEPGQAGTARAARKLAQTLPVRVCSYEGIDKAQPSDLTYDELQLTLSRAEEYFLWAVHNPHHHKHSFLQEDPYDDTSW